MMREDSGGAFDPSLFPVFEKVVPGFQGFVAAVSGTTSQVKQAAA